MKRFLILIVAAVSAASAFAQPDDAARARAGRYGQRHRHRPRQRSTPDRYSFTATVQTMAPTVEEAVNENNQQGRRRHRRAEKCRRESGGDPDLELLDLSAAGLQPAAAGQAAARHRLSGLEQRHRDAQTDRRRRPSCISAASCGACSV